MHWVMVVPGALVPAPIAAELSRAAHVPRLAQRLRRAAAISQPHAVPGASGAPHLEWLARAFGVHGSPPVAAPYAWQALARSDQHEDPAPADAGRLWLCDPVHFALMRDHLLLSTLAAAPLDEAEAVALAAVANEAAAPHGAALVRRAGQWFMVLDRAWQIDTIGLAEAAGRPIQDRLPSGPDAARWRRLLTEIQMQWHDHPVNQRRLELDRLAVNGLWLHGGGVADALPRAGYRLALSRDPIVQGWALAAGAAVVHDVAEVGPALRADRGESRSEGRRDGPARDLVEDWTRLSAPSVAEHWGLWLERLVEFEDALERRCTLSPTLGFEAVDLVLCGESTTRRIRIAPADRWRAWRQHGLEAVLAEADDTASSQAIRAPA